MENKHLNDPFYFYLKNKIEDSKTQLSTFFKHSFFHLKEYLLSLILFNLKYFRNTLLRKVLILTAFLGISLIAYRLYIYPQQTKYLPIYTDKLVYKEDSTKTFELFIEKVKQKESGGNHKVINQYGYMGHFQFGASALKAIGLDNVSKEEFLSNPDLQRCAFIMYLKHNKNYIAKYIGKYQNKTIKGIYITESGLLAACHLGGCQSVIDFLETNGERIFRDGNGTPITEYMENFGGYKLKL